MHRETLLLSEEILGKDDIGAVRSIRNLATVLCHQGKYNEAGLML